METITGIENLKDQFRKAKLMCGDLRGLKNKFPLSEKLGVPAIQTYYFAAGGNGKERIELTANCYGEEGQGIIYAYTMTELVEDIKDEKGVFHIILERIKWNAARTDGDRRNVLEFMYKNN